MTPLNNNSFLDQNSISTLLGVTASGDIRRILVDEDGAIIVNGSELSGGAISIYDEGVLINDKVRKLNFKGAAIQAVQNYLDPNEVFIYSPPSLYASHFNLTDGVSTAVVPSIVSYDRYVSSPTSEGNPFNLGTWLGGTLHPCINDTSIVYQPANPCSILDNSSTYFTATIYDADGASILAQNSVNLTGNSNTTVQNIQIEVTGFGDDSGKFKANIKTTINIGSVLPNGGRFSVKLEHDDGAEGIYTKTDGSFFYDSNNNTANISSVSLSETVGSIFTKQISGVYFYTLNSQFSLGVNGINNLNDRSYPAMQLEISDSAYGFSTILVGRTDLTAWSNLYNNIGASYSKQDWSITTSNFYSETMSGIIRARTKDWVDGSWVNSLPNSILIDTYTDNSTRIYEDFRNEVYRLTINNTAWDSTQELLTYDSGIGLQVNNSKLIYPIEDYTLFNPISGSQPDYSVSFGTKMYKRGFTHPTLDQINGVFTFTGYNWLEADLLSGGDLLLEISTDNVTWFNLNNDYAGGILSDGDGCRINSDVNTLGINGKIEFTFGLNLFSKQVFLRISYADSIRGRDLYCGSVSLNWA